MVKILFWLGIVACVALIICCFLPWTYYADNNIVGESQKIFTGFFSYQNKYGRPGKFIVFFSAIILILMIVPKLWAKRTNVFLGAFLLAYAFKTYVLFTSCYNTICPQKQVSIYVMIIASAIILVATVFPKMKV